MFVWMITHENGIYLPILWPNLVETITKPDGTERESVRKVCAAAPRTEDLHTQPKGAFHYATFTRSRGAASSSAWTERAAALG